MFENRVQSWWWECRLGRSGRRKAGRDLEERRVSGVGDRWTNAICEQRRTGLEDMAVILGWRDVRGRVEAGRPRRCLDE